MRFGLPIAVSTVAALAAIAGALVVAAYFLKLRRRRFEVPFSRLWERVLKEKDSTSLWRRLKRLLSLLLQLLLLALVLGAALDPRLGEAQVTGRHVVLIVDASASMKARDEGPTGPSRLERALAEARRVLRGLGGGDAAMVLKMDGQATALTRFESDAMTLLGALDGLEASDTPADLARALSTAANALRGRKDPMIVLVGDGAYPEAERQRAAWDGAAGLDRIDLQGIDVRFVSVGKQGRNVGVTAFNVRRYVTNKLSYEALIEVQNFGEGPEELTLTLYSGAEAIDVKTMTLAAGATRREIYQDLGGGDDRVLRAVLVPKAGADAFAVDDQAWALLPERRRQRVLLVSRDNLYLEGALLLDENLTVDKLTPEELESAQKKGLPRYDVVVLDGVTPAVRPQAAGVLYFAPSGAASPFRVRRTLEAPYITSVADDHPVTRWVTLSDVNMARASVLEPEPGDVVLASSVRDPVVIARQRPGEKTLAVGIPLDETDLVLRVAFPVLVVNAMDWFAGDDAELLTTYRTGATWAIPVDAAGAAEAVTIKTPADERLTAPVVDGRARFYGAEVGVYELTTDEGSLAVAANLASPVESDIRPAPALSLGERTLEPPPPFTPSVSRSLWMLLVLAAALLLLGEWLSFHRRVTV